MKKVIALVLVAAFIASAGVAAAQQYQGVTQPQQYIPYQGGTQQYVPYQGSTQPQQYLPQQGTAPAESTINIPPPPSKPKPDMKYGNTARAALVGEGLSQASQGNARVYIKEGNVIEADVYLVHDASPYELAPTMANLTYMLASFYSLTEKPNSNIALKVYDTSGKVIIDALFNTAKNSFDYFKVPAAATPPQRQPATGRQPVYGGSPAYGVG